MKLTVLLALLFSLSSAFAQVSKAEFSKLVDVFHLEYDQELARQGAVFKVNHTSSGADPDMWWNLPNVHAS